MEITRTANAGVLLKLDGVSILMDGVCREVKPYPATPPEIKAALSARFPDAVAFTHGHKDHYDPAFAAEYQKQTGGVVLGPEDLPGCKSEMTPVTVGTVTVTPIKSRHIGAAGKIVSHASFIVKGSKCIWFTGDAAPTQWRQNELPKPDVLIVPYAYATTPTAWTLTESLGASSVVLLHLPDKEKDDIGLWNAVEATAGQAEKLYIPDMGQTISL